jgi:hypothetical protein
MGDNGITPAGVRPLRVERWCAGVNALFSMEKRGLTVEAAADAAR